MASMQQVVRRLSIEATTRGVREAEQAVKGLSGSLDGVAASSQRAERATQSMESRLGSIQRKYDEQYRAQQAQAKVERDLMQAQAQGLVTQQRRLELLSLAAERHGLATSAAKAFAAANDNVTASTKLTSTQLLNLTRQGNDVVTMFALGAAPMQVFASQAGQIVDALQNGPDGLRGSLKAIGESLKGLVLGFPVATAAIAGATLAVGAAYIAYRTLTPEVKSLDDILATHKANLERLGPAYAGIIEKTRELSVESQKLAELRARSVADDAMKRMAADTEAAIVNIIKAEGILSSRFSGAAEAIDQFRKSMDAVAFQETIASLESTGMITEGVAKELLKASDAARGTQDELQGVGKATDPVAKGFADMTAEIAKIDRFDVGGRLGDIEDAAGDLMKQMQSGQITNKQFAASIQAIENANPDVGGILAKIGSIAAAAMQAQSDVGAFTRMLQGMGGAAPKGDRVDTAGAMDRAQEQYDYLFTMSRRIGDAFKEIDPDKPKKLKHHIDAAANAYRDLIKNAQDRIDQMKLEEQMVGKNGVAADTLRFKLDLLQDATDKGRKMTDAKRAAIEKLTEAYRVQATVNAELTAQEGLAFERSLIGLSDTDIRVAETLRDIGLDINSIEGERVANAIRYTDQLQRQQARYEEMAGIIGDTLGSALVGVFEGGITSFDEFMDHVTKGFAQLGEANIMRLFDFGPNGIFAGSGQTGGQADGADPWSGGFREIGAQIADGVEKGAAAGTAGGLIAVFKGMGLSDANAGIAAGGIGVVAGAAGIGYQSANPIMGAIGGAVSGFGAGASIAALGAAGGPIGAVIGAVVGLVSGILGKMESEKKEREAAKQALQQQTAAITQMLQISRGQGIGETQKQYQEYADASAKLQALAVKAKDNKLLGELQDAANKTFNILYRELLDKMDGFNQALRDGLGKNSPFEQGRVAILGLREELKGWVADVEFMSRESSRLGGGNIPEAEIQRRIKEAQEAAQAMAVASLTGAKELSAVESEILRLQGAAVGLQSTLEQLGMSSDEAAAAIADGLGKAMDKLRADFMGGVDRRFYEANGQSYLNDLLDLANQTKAALDDSAALGGLGMERIRETFRLSAQSIANDSNLSAAQVAEANRVLADALAAIGMTVPQAVKDATDAIAQSFDRAGLQSKLNDASGKGYLNQFASLRTEVTGLMGQTNSLADIGLISQYSAAAARQIAESSGLSSEAIRGLATTFPLFGQTLLRVADDMDKAAEQAQRAEEASAAAAAAAARRAAILGLQPGLLERTQGTAAAQDWQLSQLAVGNVGLSGIRNAGSVDAARAQLELFINTIKRTGQSADDISQAGQLAYQVFDQVVQSLQTAQSEADRLAESFQSMAESVSDSLTSFADRATSELESTFNRAIDAYRSQYSDLVDAITGARSYLDSIATLSTNPQTQFEIMQGRFRDAASAASGGDAAALRGLTGQAGSYLDAAAQFFPAGTQQYFQAVEEVRAALGTGIGAAQDRANSVQGQIERLNTLMEANTRAIQDTVGRLIEQVKSMGLGQNMLLGQIAKILEQDKPAADLLRAVQALIAATKENGDQLGAIAKKKAA